MATTTSYITRAPETDFATVTSWLPLKTPFPLPLGCSSSISAFGTNAIIAFDPGYGLSIDINAKCVPEAVTSWWETRDARLTAGGVTTIYSIGPLVCPDAYTTALTSVFDSAKTQILCCPS